MIIAHLHGPRGEPLGITVEINHTGEGIRYGHRVFLYDSLCSKPDFHFYREYVEYN